MSILALICIIAAAVCEFAAGLNVTITIGSKPLNLMCLGFGFLIVGLYLLK